MKSPGIFWLSVVIGVFLFSLTAMPSEARAFSLASLVEKHQSRMQERYERMSYRLCNAVSSFLPFFGSDAWCLGEGKEPTDFDGPLLIIEGSAEQATSTTTSVDELLLIRTSAPDDVATTTLLLIR